MNNIKLSDLVKMDSPKAVLHEVKIILSLIDADFDIDSVTAAFNTTASLYSGSYTGYQACNTVYHDFQHITDTFLAMVRLIHGAALHGKDFTERQIVLGLIAMLFHDAGYIQEEHDKDGTGAKYTTVHVQRSMDFLQRHGPEHGLSYEEIPTGQAMILCTDLTVDIADIVFPSPNLKLMGKILATADLMAQMADRTYLEKLLLLYQEFREGKVRGYESEVDLLRKTIEFYDLIIQRFEMKLDGVDRFMRSHFASRWGIYTDLYQTAIEKQKNYLKHILEIPGSDPLDHLRRNGIVDSIRNRNKKTVVSYKKMLDLR